MAGYIGSKASVVSNGAERKKVFDITTTTTSLTGCSYTPNQVHVFHNGVRLVDGTDYTATDGSTVTLTTAAQSGDEVVVVSYATFQPADAYTKTESDGRFVNVTGDTMTGRLTISRANDDKTFLVNTGGGYGAFALSSGSDSTFFGHAALPTHFVNNSEAGDAIVRSSNGIALAGGGGSVGMRIDASGRVTMPYQPCFSAVHEVGGNLTSDTTYRVKPYSTVLTNIGGHYNSSTYRFTAPVNGNYAFFTYNLQLDDTDTVFAFFKNGSMAFGVNGQSRSISNNSNEINVAAQCILTLNANDYIEVRYTRTGGAGSIYSAHTGFSGYLLG